jgi:hypothetical protein
MNSVPRALKRLCAKHRASAKAEVRENAKYTMDSVLRSNFAGGRIRKTETNVFEIRRDLGFRPAGGCGRNAGRISFFGGRANKKVLLVKGIL